MPMCVSPRPMSHVTRSVMIEPVGNGQDFSPGLKLGYAPVVDVVITQCRCLVLCCALSLASPCGPRGLGSMYINITDSARLSTLGGLTASNPSANNSRDKAAEAWRAASSPVLVMITPVSGGGFVPSGTGPSRIFRIGCGSDTRQCPKCKAAATSAPKPAASTSVML